MRLRSILSTSALLLVLAGAVFSAGSARLTLVNVGLRVSYPWPRAAGAWVAFSAAVAAAVLFRRLWARVLLTCLAALSLYAALHLTAFRFDANDTGVSLRDVLGANRLSWAQVQKVETGPGILVLVGPGERRVRLDTTDLSPTDAAALDRTVARRLAEAARR
jgi:hypothetical protein